MRLKEGVDLTDVSWRMFHAAIVADGVYHQFGSEAVITSGVDGTHSAKTKHNPANNESGLGEALDFRTSNVRHPEAVAEALQKALGDDYDVVLESDHIHAEWDPD